LMLPRLASRTNKFRW